MIILWNLLTTCKQKKLIFFFFFSFHFSIFRFITIFVNISRYLLNPNMEIVRCFGVEYNEDELADAVLKELKRTQN